MVSIETKKVIYASLLLLTDKSSDFSRNSPQRWQQTFSYIFFVNWFVHIDSPWIFWREKNIWNDLFFRLLPNSSLHPNCWNYYGDIIQLCNFLMQCYKGHCVGARLNGSKVIHPKYYTVKIYRKLKPTIGMITYRNTVL